MRIMICFSPSRNFLEDDRNADHDLLFSVCAAFRWRGPRVSPDRSRARLAGALEDERPS
jgi:hypothetical protein